MSEPSPGYAFPRQLHGGHAWKLPQEPKESRVVTGLGGIMWESFYHEISLSTQPSPGSPQGRAPSSELPLPTHPMATTSGGFMMSSQDRSLGIGVRWGLCVCSC